MSASPPAQRVFGPGAPAQGPAVPAISPAQSDYLDGLRAIAAQMVLLTHVLALIIGDGKLTSALGSAAVATFFLLSGFLVTYSALSKPPASGYGLADFLSDRAFRIYAAYLPALVFTALADISLMHSAYYPKDAHGGPAQFFGNLVMLQDFPVFQVLRRAGADAPWFVSAYGSAGQFWTISIEFWIYVAFGISFYALRTGKPKLLGVAGLTLAFAAIEPLYHFAGGFGECLTMLWLAGCAAAFGLVYQGRVRALFGLKPVQRRIMKRVWLAIAAIFLGFIAMRGLTSRLHWYDLQIGLYTGIVLFALFHFIGPAARFPLGRLWRAVAEYSYSLYLTHCTVLIAIATVTGGALKGPLYIALLILAPNLFAVAFWYLFERHYRGWSRAFRRWWHAGASIRPQAKSNAASTG